jgi:hypothetical protein
MKSQSNSDATEGCAPPTASAAKRPARPRCYSCKHGGDAFRIIGKTHLHCQHPEEAVAGEKDGWDTLRLWCDQCKAWEAKS